MNWQQLKKLREERGQASKDMQAIITKAETEKRDMSAEEVAKFDELHKRSEELAQTIDRYEKAKTLEDQLTAANGAQQQRVGRENVGNSLDMPEKDFQRYSILRALQCRLNNKPLDGIEAEVNAEMAKRAGKAAQGFYVPWDAGSRNLEQRSLTTSTGSGAVGVKLLPDLIGLLRNALVLNQLGATVMADMVGKFSLPRQSAGATAYWVGEAGSPTGTNQTLDQVSFVPNTVGAYTDISRQFINQSSIDAESFVMNDLAAVLARAIDLAGFAGTGSSNQPTGIINQSGVSVVSHGTNGGAETWATIVSYETAVLAANVNPASKLSYLANSKVGAALKQLDKTSGGFGQFVLGPDGKVNNYNFVTTNAVPSNGTKGSGSNLSTMIFGNFADLVIALWGGLDVVVDPFTGSSAGTVRIVALQDVDVEVRHAASFAVATDIIA